MDDRGPGRPPRRRTSSSDFSAKQIARAVVDGRKVTLRRGDTSYTGYVFGGDDFHWGIVRESPDAKGVETWLVHKAGTDVRLHPEPTLQSEPQCATIQKMVAGYRAHLEADVFGRQERSPQ